MTVSKKELKKKIKRRKLFKRILADLKKKKEYPEVVLRKMGEYNIDGKIQYYENQLKRT
ncbi:MAG TPA: hypothetical protein VMV95_03490 [Bacillota bacterium]|nr:hypothetical protein [Bacillota bacterium]